MSPNVPSVPLIPAHDSLSQPSGEGRIKEIIEPGPEHELEDLQLSQRPIIGPSEQACLQEGLKREIVAIKA